MNIRYDDGAVIHACEGARMVSFDPGTFLVWTKCHRDVPANQGFESDCAPTCPACITALGKEVSRGE